MTPPRRRRGKENIAGLPATSYAVGGLVRFATFKHISLIENHLRPLSRIGPEIALPFNNRGRVQFFGGGRPETVMGIRQTKEDILMSHEQPNFEITPSPKRKTAAGVTVVLCLLAGNFYLYSRVNRAEVDAHTLRQTLEEKLARVEKKSTFHLNNTQREIEDLRESLDQARSQASKTAKSEARRQTDKLGKNIAARQRSAKEAVMSEMRTVGDMAFETAGKVEGIEGIEGELGGVKDELAGTAERLESTDRVLKDTKAHVRSIGDWVAGNASEINKLRGEWRSTINSFPTFRERGDATRGRRSYAAAQDESQAQQVHRRDSGRRQDDGQEGAVRKRACRVLRRPPQRTLRGGDDGGQERPCHGISFTAEGRRRPGVKLDSWSSRLHKGTDADVRPLPCICLAFTVPAP